MVHFKPQFSVAVFQKISRPNPHVAKILAFRPKKARKRQKGDATIRKRKFLPHFSREKAKKSDKLTEELELGLMNEQL